MQNEIKNKSASNVMDATGYWREYPERDLEHVRRYPVTVERLDEKDVWRKRYIKLVCVLPDLHGINIGKKEYISILHQELKKQSAEDYIRSFYVEKVIIWNRSSQYDEADCQELLSFIRINFNCIDDMKCITVNDGLEYIELWNYEEPILAAGLGAIGYIKGYDYINTDNIDEYCESLSESHYPVEKAFLISAQEILARTIFQGVRREKIVFKEFQEHHGFCFEDVFRDKLQELEDEGYLKVEKDYCIFLQKEKQMEILNVLLEQ